ncbi:MAG TPA: transposase [Blastocatellia bacterium]|nr:transposase [Blastocatellia bacterium]
MKLTIGLKLKPTPEQAQALAETLSRANAAANECSRVAWESRTFGQFKLHKLAYTLIREKYGLSAQVAVRVIAKVADAYKLDKRRMRVFRADGSIAYDDRILRYGTESVSIWTLAGRQKILFVGGEHQRRLLHSRQGESDLVYRKGKWYLFATVNVVEPPTDDDPDGMLGVDFGIARIAADSEGRSYSGAHLRNLRKRHRRLRAKLQSKGTKSAKRLLKKRSLKERRFATHTNHCISKQIVQTAQRTKQAIVLEDLKDIRLRARVSRKVRTELHNWAFAQLRAMIEYKAKLAGVTVLTVNPKYTSQTCSQCQHRSKSNRKSQSRFQCRQCGFSCNADINAARNIANRAAVNQPNAVYSLRRDEPQAA